QLRRRPLARGRGGRRAALGQALRRRCARRRLAARDRRPRPRRHLPRRRRHPALERGPRLRAPPAAPARGAAREAPRPRPALPARGGGRGGAGDGTRLPGGRPAAPPHRRGRAGRGGALRGDRIVEWESEVLALLVDGQATRGPVRAGTTADVVTAETPFYAESGGQVGDRGWLETGAGAKVEVTDTQKLAPAVIAHRGVVRAGELAVGDRVRLRIDAARRDAARLNHSATHLLHAALRRRLGEHVKQAGSLVTPERLRFDFSHPKPVDDGTLRDIEDETNAYIRANAEVTTEETTYDDAIKAGAAALLRASNWRRATAASRGRPSTPA